jgi:glycosyltransferase involved in cell wall biosynthesis
VTLSPLPKIAVFASFSGQGGVERMLVNLCSGISAAGYPLDLVLVKDRSECLDDLPPQVRVVRLGTGHTFASTFALASYLKRERPAALLAAKDRAGRTAVAARRLAGVPVRIVFRLGTTLSAALEGKPAWRKWLWYLPMRAIYPRADAIVAVSRGVADDLANITRLPAERFNVVPNPVVTPRLAALAAQEAPHPWLTDGGAPVVLGIGRLTRQKDFPSLIRAFALVRRERPCRLVILGEGGDRPALEKLAKELGVGSDLLLPGFARNPYAWLSRVSLFVLSSAWEGSPNALTEALALGVPVVATDCQSGPREILDGGRIAPLVEVGNVERMAAAMLHTLEDPPAPESLRRAAAPYTVEDSSRRYLELLLGADLTSKESSC